MFDRLTNTFSSIFSSITGNSTVTQKNIKESVQKVTEGLLDADVPYEVVQTFIKGIQEEIIGQKVLSATKPADQFLKVVKDVNIVVVVVNYWKLMLNHI